MTEIGRLDPSDIRRGDWVGRWLPEWAEPYARLARIDRPIGTWLLLFPAWWGIALAAPAGPRSGWPDPVLLLLFAIGAVAMRGAGCTLNDIADRDYDARVGRTRLRPLPSGRVTVVQAGVFLLAQLAVGAAVLFSLNRLSILLGLAVLGLIGTYPFMKRVTYWPQLFLGLNFNWGALIGWTAVTGTLSAPPLLLYLGGVFWTLGYDTIYAHQDREDDARIGVKSSALALGSRTRPFLFAFYAGALLLWAMAGAAAGLGIAFWAALAAAALQLIWQAARVDTDDPADCLRKFRSNRAVGWLLLAGIVAGHFA
jgi:4-hydroxybenzoate polyprenyltransferase